MGSKRKDYDDDRLVLAIARGDQTYQQICDEFGISRSLLFKIVHGQARRELQPRIQAAVGAFVDQAKRLAASWARQLVVRHITEGLQGGSETARKCREYVLGLTLGNSPRPTTNILLAQRQEMNTPDFLDSLPQEKRQRVLEVLGGPQD